MATYLLVLFLNLIMCVISTPTESCMNAADSKVCVEAEGFYYLLGNGTWNISVTEGDALAERETFLKHLESGNCEVVTAAKSPKPDDDSCYCELGIPLPRHPITNGLFMRGDLSCMRELQRSLPPTVWHPLRKLIEQCRFLGPIHFPFLCVFNNNLMEMRHTYQNPKPLKKHPHYDNIRLERTHLTWRNASSTAAKSEIKTRTSPKSDTRKVSGNNTIPYENGTSPDAPIQVKMLNGTYFSVYTDNETEVDHVTVVKNSVNNQTIHFSGPAECLRKHRKWDVFPPCSYAIDVSNASDCSDLRLTFRVASAIIFQHMASLDTQVIVEEPSWDSYMADVGNDSLAEDDEANLICENFPTHLSAIEMWAEAKHIATILSFETEEFVSIGEELRLTGATSQKIVREEEYTSLSRFWAKFHFGDCLYRQCWRDLWNVIPPDMLHSSYRILENPDDDAYLRLRYFMPFFIICFVLLVRNCIINSEDIVGLE